MAKNNFLKRILVGLTGENADEIISKIEEADEFGISDVSLFLEIIFEKPILVASGQSCVVYDGDICLGGGVVV